MRFVCFVIPLVMMMSWCIPAMGYGGGDYTPLHDMSQAFNYKAVFLV
jgi:hypothetical protein